jgi:phospholipid/cholesterol/gamma-HCH transport system permease protein
MSQSIKLPAVISYQNILEYHDKSLNIMNELDPNSKLTLDFSEVKQMDSTCVVLFNHIKEKAVEKEIELTYTNLSEPVKETFSLFSKVSADNTKSMSEISFFEKLGSNLYDRIIFIKEFIILIADISYWSSVNVFRKNLIRQGEVIKQGLLIGVNALPIVGLIAFLIGFILALQSANQLRQFGANIYVADLVAIAMISEMGPLLTAIIVAGRSGSAIAAEIATMKVTEELDALKSMGIDPIPYLFVPKVYAILIVVPMLTVLANFIGIFGGSILSLFYMDIGIVPFYNEVFSVLRNKEIIVAIIKSFTFALLIIVTAIHFGISTEGGSESVGKSTTSSVVTSIFLVIFADTMIGLIFYL